MQAVNGFTFIVAGGQENVNKEIAGTATFEMFKKCFIKNLIKFKKNHETIEVYSRNVKFRKQEASDKIETLNREICWICEKVSARYRVGHKTLSI